MRAVILGLVLLLPSCGVPSAEACNRPSLSDEQKASVVGANLPQVVDVFSLGREFSDNSVAALQKYGGRPLLLRAEVQSVMAGTPNTVLLANGFTTVNAMVASDADVEKLHEGSAVLLFCQGVTHSEFEVAANGCDVVGAT